MNDSFDALDQFDFNATAHETWDFADLVATLGPLFFHGQSSGDIDGTTMQVPDITQTTPFTCAIVSQQMILQAFGIDVSEAQLTYEATAHGWLTNQGTSMEDMSKLLELHRVPSHMNYHGTVEDLIGELAQGHKVIVGVDSGDLWNTSLFQFLHPHQADHAIVVTGLDMSDPAHPRVFVNDPGTPGGGESYPLDQFLEAWNCSDNFYVATDHAPADLTSHSDFGANFNSATGMYMDVNFWKGLFLNLARVVATDALFQESGPLFSPDQTHTPISPWETMSGDQRNALFMQI